MLTAKQILKSLKWSGMSLQEATDGMRRMSNLGMTPGVSFWRSVDPDTYGPKLKRALKMARISCDDRFNQFLVDWWVARALESYKWDHRSLRTKRVGFIALVLMDLKPEGERLTAALRLGHDWAEATSEVDTLIRKLIELQQDTVERSGSLHRDARAALGLVSTDLEAPSRG